MQGSLMLVGLLLAVLAGLALAQDYKHYDDPNYVYQIVTRIQEPLMFKDKKTGNFTGYLMDLIEGMTKLMNITYELHAAPDYGLERNPGVWDGCVGELVNETADMAVAVIPVSPERENAIDFTLPIFKSMGHSIMMKDFDVPIHMFKVFAMATDMTWGGLVFDIFFFAFLIWMFERWSPYSYQNSPEMYKEELEEMNEEPKIWGIKACIFHTAKLTMPSGIEEGPKSYSGSCLSSVYWSFTFCLVASYTANLAAYMTVVRLRVPIYSLDMLSRYSSMKYSTIEDSMTADFIKRMVKVEELFYFSWKEIAMNESLTQNERSDLAIWDYPVSRKWTKLWDRVRSSGPPADLEEAFGRIQASPKLYKGFAYIGSEIDIEYGLKTSCTGREVGRPFGRVPLAAATQQGSPLREKMNDAIRKLAEEGVMDDLMNRWWVNNPNFQECIPADRIETMTIHNIGGFFLVFYSVLIIAIFGIGLEYWYYRHIKGCRGEKKKKKKEIISMEGDSTISTMKPSWFREAEAKVRKRPAKKRACKKGMF